jgi:NAD(P)H-dependent FMN reductase
MAKLLLISGSLRGGSTNSATMRTAAALALAGSGSMQRLGRSKRRPTYEMPVAWINVSGAAAPSGGSDAHDSLRKVPGFTGAQIVEEAVLRLPLSRTDVGADGLIAPPEARKQIVTAVAALAAATS